MVTGMKQKVITVRVIGYENNDFTEHEFPKINKLLEDGWNIVNVYLQQVESQHTAGVAIITFILNKV
jgi:uncharacterized BrkB/YihY/UPF0761 family membrane protein